MRPRSPWTIMAGMPQGCAIRTRPTSASAISPASMPPAKMKMTDPQDGRGRCVTGLTVQADPVLCDCDASPWFHLAETLASTPWTTTSDRNRHVVLGQRWIGRRSRRTPSDLPLPRPYGTALASLHVIGKLDLAEVAFPGHKWVPWCSITKQACGTRRAGLSYRASIPQYRAPGAASSGAASAFSIRPLPCHLVGGVGRLEWPDPGR
jgi:hypothetical protein